MQRFRTGFSLLPPARRIGHEFDLDAAGRPRAGPPHGLAHGGGAARARRRSLVRALCRSRLRRQRGDRRPRLSLARPKSWRNSPWPTCMACGMRAWRPPPSISRATAPWWRTRICPAGGSARARGHRRRPAALPPADRQWPARRAWWRTCCFPPSMPLPRALSPRWIRDVLRGELRFQGVVFTDDMSMAGPPRPAISSTRARRALAAGCDMVPICNNRPSVVTAARSTRMSSRSRPRVCAWCACAAAMACRARNCWPRASGSGCRELLARCTAPPALQLEAGSA